MSAREALAEIRRKVAANKAALADAYNEVRRHPVIEVSHERLGRLAQICAPRQTEPPPAPPTQPSLPWHAIRG